SPSRSRTQGTSRRPRVSRVRAGQRLAYSSGYRRGHRVLSSRRLEGIEAVQKWLRDMLQGPSNGAVGQFRERGPLIAVPCKLGIERHGPEAGDLQRSLVG